MENLFVPYQADKSIAANHVLVLAPHPDDEVFGCGGAIMRHTLENVPVRVIIVTDGDYSVNQSEISDYIQLRQNESIAAASILEYGQPVFWHYHDRDLYYSEKLITEILSAIQDTETDLVYAPSVYEIHPDHRALGMATLEAIRRCKKQTKLALYEIGQPIQPNLLLDISDLAERKMKAMNCFASQNAKQRYDLDIAALNRYRTYTLPTEVTAAEAYILTSTEEQAHDPLKLYQSEHTRQQKSGLALDTKDFPLVSVIIRSMDRDSLSDALDSVALQTYPNIEVVLVNAKGHIHHAVGEWCGRFPIRFVQSETNLDRSKAANTGLEAVQGEFIIFLDDDDRFLPHHISTLKDGFLQSESLVAVYSAVQCVNESGENIKLINEEFDATQLHINNFIPIHSILFRRSILQKECYFDEKLPVCEDWDFWLQMLQHGTFKFINDVGAVYRIQHGSGSGVWENTELTQRTMLSIYRKWLPHLNDKALWSIFEYARYKKMYTEFHIQTNAIIQQKDSQISTLNQLIAERDQMITERNNQLTALYTSTSWRITKPFRKIKSFLSQYFKR